jgi:hypothetical protein
VNDNEAQLIETGLLIRELLKPLASGDRDGIDQTCERIESMPRDDLNAVVFAALLVMSETL